ncbi:MAG: hypothetical protein ACYSRR_02555, partial [Planctomycetota bacterium]
TVLYRRFIGVPLVAGLAALLWAIDDAHGMPIGFLANRNALLATLFGVLAIIAHNKWRRDSWHVGAILGPVFLSASLLSAEAGIATCAYLLAHTIFVDRASWVQRFKTLLPYVAVVMLWRIIWTHLGYGIANIEFYIDPINDPACFMTAVINRGPVLLLGQWALPPADIAYMLNPRQSKLLWFIAIAFLTVLAVLLIPLLRKNRTARFWALGMVLSIIPACATIPADRLLLFVGIGAMGLLAQFLLAVFGKAQGQPSLLVWKLPAMLLGLFLILVHLIIAPLALPIRAGNPTGPKKLMDQFCIKSPLDQSIENKDLIIINPPVALLGSFSPVAWAANGQPVPRHFRVLTSSLFKPVVVRRPDEKTLIIRPRYGYLAWEGDRLFRSKAHPMSLGQRVKLTGMTVEITKLTRDNRPLEAAFKFEVPLEDPSLYWLQFKDGAFVPFKPPAIGETIKLNAKIKF